MDIAWSTSSSTASLARWSSRDLSADVTEESRPMADPSDPLDIGASMPGKVLKSCARWVAGSSRATRYWCWKP